MPYVAHCLDKPDHGALRAEVRDVHLGYLESIKDRLLAVGALLEDDGGGAHGSVLIYDVEDRATAEELVANDPFSKAGLFASVAVVRWRKAFFNFENCL